MAMMGAQQQQAEATAAAQCDVQNIYVDTVKAIERDEGEGGGDEKHSSTGIK